MRRFEFSEGSSNKFWQADLQGSELLISWGKLGTSGQQQKKSFASAAAAQVELDKLVAEKTKKGYLEVAAAESTAAAATEPTVAATAAATAAAPPAAKAASKGAARGATSAVAESPAAPAAHPDLVPAPVAAAEASAAAPELPERILPSEPGYTAEPPKLPDESTCLAGLRDFFHQKTWSTYTYLSELQSGLSHATGVYRELAERILDSYAQGKAPKTLDPDADAALSNLAPPELFVPYLLSRGGFAGVIRTLHRSCYLVPVAVGGQGGSWRYFQASEPSVERGLWGQNFAAFVRSLLPVLPEGAYAAGHAEAAKLRDEPLACRITLSYALADRQWTAADTAALLELKKNEYYFSLPRLLFETLRDPTLVTRLAQRHPGDVPQDELTNDLGLAAMPAVIASFASDPKNNYRAEALARIESLAVARALVDALPTKHAAETAKQYYERRPDLAIVALSPIVARGDKLAPYVKPVLDAVVRKNPALPGQLAAHLDAKSRALFGTASAAASVPEATAGELPPVLLTPLAPPKRGAAPSLPEFLSVDALPPILLADKTRCLPAAAVRIVLSILQRSSLAAPHPELAAARAACDAASLSAFAWALFEQWLASGVGSKENWAFTALGLLGDDEAARRLTPLIRTWPGESQHARAGLGLDILAGIGTDLALMHLHGVAEKVKFKALQEKAREKIGAIAAARGLTTEELADRLVPDLGLDDDGSLTLSFGARAFRVGFDEALSPVVRDATGKLLTELPKANKSDDADLAAAATERWKTLKKDARAIASAQLTRLELAMCAQRRWQRADFETFILRHPLLVHLARRLLWGVFVGPELAQTFRIAEDGSFAGPDDDALQLPPAAVIGLVHRLEMPAELLGKWGAVLADYKILQPFDQLGRQVFLPTEAEKQASMLPRLKKAQVKTGKVMGLEVRGWRKGEPQDAGWVYDMNKPLPGGFEASFSLGGGLCMGAPDMNPPLQELDGLWLTRKDGGKATFGELSPTVFSELVREYEGLRE
jgi:predicted DNA-binding WGR domain protein